MSARDALRRAVAAEFQRLDAHDWGYGHGFCADPDADEETAAFVDAAIRIVLDRAVASIEAELYDGVPVGGFVLARSAQEAADLLRRLAAAPTAPATPCGTCHGSGLDPADEGDYDPAVQRHNPSTIGPCPTCCGSRTNPTSSKEN